MRLMGLWTARAGAARPRCPQAALAGWRRASAGARRASAEVVLRLMRGEAAELLSRELGLPLFKLEQWRQKAEAALEGALKERETDPADGQLAAAMQRIGELSMEIELLRAKMERPGPLARRRSRRWPTYLRSHRPPLWCRAGLPGLGGPSVHVLRRAAGGRGGGRVETEPSMPWPEACHLRCGPAGRYPR